MLNNQSSALTHNFPGSLPSTLDARTLSEWGNLPSLLDAAARLRDEGHQRLISYSAQGVYSADAALSRCVPLLYFCTTT